MEKPVNKFEGYLKSGFLEQVIRMMPNANEMDTVYCIKWMWGCLSNDDIGVLTHRLLVPKFMDLMSQLQNCPQNSDIVWTSVKIVGYFFNNNNQEETRILASRTGVRTLSEMVVKYHDTDKDNLVFCNENESGMHVKVLIFAIFALCQKPAGSTNDNLYYPMMAGATRVLLPLISKFLLSFLTQYPKVDVYHRDVYRTLVGEGALLQCLFMSEQSGDILLLVKSDIIRHLLDIYEKQTILRGCDVHSCDCVRLRSSIELCFQYIGDLRIAKTKEKLPYVETLVRALRIKKLATCKTCPPFYDHFQKRWIPYESYGAKIMYFLASPGSSDFMDESPHPEEYQRVLLECGAPEAMIDLLLLCVDDAKMMNNLYPAFGMMLTACESTDLVDRLVPGYHVLLKHAECIDRVLGKDEHNIIYDSVILSLGKGLVNCSNDQLVTDLVMKSDLFDVLATCIATKSPDIDDYIPMLTIFTHCEKIGGIAPKSMAEKATKLILALWTKAKWLQGLMEKGSETSPFVLFGILLITNKYLPYVINTITDVKSIEDFAASILCSDLDKPIIGRCGRVPNILPLVWTFIKRDPPGPIVGTLTILARQRGYMFLPFVSSGSAKKNKKNCTTNPVENKAKLYKYVNEHLIQFLDNPIIGGKPADENTLHELSDSLVMIVKSYTTDEELYALEDLASPVMWLASKTDIEVVINNVQTFIHILHSE